MLHRTFDLEVSPRDDGTSVVAVRGELDISAAADLRRLVGDLMGGGGRHLVVDLRETTLVDSSGLGALLWAEHRLLALGGHLMVVNLSPGVARVFKLSGLDTHFH